MTKRKQMSDDARAQVMSERAHNEVAEFIEDIEKTLARTVAMTQLALSVPFRTPAVRVGLIKAVRDINARTSLGMLDIKAEMPAVCSTAHDAVAVALAEQLNATVETAARMIDEQTRLLDEALGVDTPSPLQ
jgi:hypothetical protein